MICWASATKRRSQASGSKARIDAGYAPHHTSALLVRTRAIRAEGEGTVEAAADLAREEAVEAAEQEASPTRPGLRNGARGPSKVPAAEEPAP